MATTTRTSTTALQAAMKGERVTDRQAKSALGAAVDKIASLSKRAEKSKDAMMATGTQVLHTAETQGSLFLSSMAEGYLGPDKLKVGGVDVRAPMGLAAAGYGLYETMTGGKAGGHALALGNGLLGSWLASMAVRAGQILAEKRAGTPEPPALPTALQGLLPAPGLVEDDLRGPLREVLLTPEGDDFQGRARRRQQGQDPRRRQMRRRMRRRMKQRFLRAQQGEEPLEPEDDFYDEETD